MNAQEYHLKDFAENNLITIFGDLESNRINLKIAKLEIDLGEEQFDVHPEKTIQNSLV